MGSRLLGAVGALLVGLGQIGSGARADVVSTPYPIDGANDTAAGRGAPFAGFEYARPADTFQDRVEIRDYYGNLKRAIPREDIPRPRRGCRWMAGRMGRAGWRSAASGRLLFILVSDDTTPTDGQPSDVLLRYDVSADSLTRMARLELFNRGDIWPHLAAAHHAGYVYVGTGSGQIQSFLAFSPIPDRRRRELWTLPGRRSCMGSRSIGMRAGHVRRERCGGVSGDAPGPAFDDADVHAARGGLGHSGAGVG